MHFVRVRRFVVEIHHNVVGRLLFSNVSADSSIAILYFFEDFVFLGKSKSSLVSLTFTMSAMTWKPRTVISQSPKIHFLISCSVKFGVLKFVSGVSDHFEHVVGVLPGVFLRDLFLDLPFRLVGKIVVASYISGLNEPAPLPCKCLTNVLRSQVSVRILLSSCGAVGLPTAFFCGHRCTVGIDRYPPMCLDAQNGIKAKRQPFVAGVVL